MAGLPWEDYSSSQETGPWSSYAPVAQAPAADVEAADHGLSERKKLSSARLAVEPIVSYPKTYARMNQEAVDQMSHGVDQLTASGNGAWETAKGAGNVALGGIGYVASPINAAYRSVVGQPIEDVTGIPREYTEFAAQLATPGIGLTGAGKDPAGLLKTNVTKPTGDPVGDVVAAANRVSELAPSPINVPRAFASDSIATQRAGQLARNVPIIGDSIPKATGEMVDQMGSATKSIASHYGEGSGPHVANRIGRTIGESAEAETKAATDTARRSDEALDAAWQRNTDAAHESIASHEAQSLEQARQAVGDMSPQEMGATLIQRLRTGEQQARDAKEALYNRAGAMDASVHVSEVGNVRAKVAQGLEDAGVGVDKEITPAANKMMDELQRLSNLEIPNKAVGTRIAATGTETPVAVSAHGIEQARKRLNFFRSAASNPADRRAAAQIIRHFDDWQANAFETALFSGDDKAVQAFRDARAANTSWRQRFFNDGDDAGKFIERVVMGEVTPQEFSNMLVGASQVGAKGVSSRLLTRVAEATGNDPEALQAIRGGVWNRLSQSTEGVAAKAPGKVANDINEFLQGSGRDVAQRLFTPEQQNIMRAYADTLRRGIEAREMVASVAKNTRPTPMNVGIGPMQELANSVLGKGGKSDEALFSAIDAYARSGARGDVRTLSDIVKAVPAKDKGDLAGAIIRNLGQSKKTGEFSPDLFASEWLKYTPQAKTVLLGNAGAHRQALNDIAMISQRYKDVGRRFGNPSGTGQQVAGLGVLGSVITHPYIAIPSLVGGAIFAKILSAPATAQRAATWGKTVTALSRGATPERIAAFESASKSLAAASNKLGANISAADFMRPIQGPVTGGATDEDPEPKRVNNN